MLARKVKKTEEAMMPLVDKGGGTPNLYIIPLEQKLPEWRPVIESSSPLGSSEQGLSQFHRFEIPSADLGVVG